MTIQNKSTTAQYGTGEVKPSYPDTAKAPDILDRLRKQAADVIDWHGQTMKEWDKIRGVVETHKGSDLPRLMFEGLVESLAELMTEGADEIEKQRRNVRHWREECGKRAGSGGVAQASLPPIVDRAELVELLEDLASVNLSREAVERQARRMADDLMARGLSLSRPEDK